MTEFFTNPVVLTFLGLGVCFALATVLLQWIRPLREFRLPLAIIAGVVGIGLRILFPDWMDAEVLKTLVYHGLALVFISVGLQVSRRVKQTTSEISIGFSISIMGALQGIIGASVIMLATLLKEEQVHIGLGLLLPLGFNQGPGQALSFGRAWEATGLVNGGDIGIIIAAIGFAWSIVIGIPLVLVGKKRGWLARDLAEYSEAHPENLPEVQGTWLSEPEKLSQSIAWVVATYALTFALLDVVTTQLAGKEKIVNMIWGLHFVVALFTSMIMRRLVIHGQEEHERLEHNQRMQVISNVVVDLTTCAGLVAIQVAVLSQNLGMVLLLTSLGGIASLGLALFLYRRVFHTLPFHHLVVWFGTCTGTFPVGLSLLRMIDPSLKTPIAVNYSKGIAFALITSMPLLVLLGYATSQYPENYPAAGWKTFMGLFLYFGVLLLGWRRFWVKSTSEAQSLN